MSARAHVVLANPAITSSRRARFPLSLLNLAAALAPEYDCTLIDGNVRADAVQAAVGAAGAAGCAAFGVSVMGGPQVRTAIEMSRAVRARHPRLPIVWGGYFPSLYPQVALQAEYVDYVVRGQGEQTLPELLGALARGAPLDPVAGLSHRAAGGVVHNPGRRFQAPSGAPLPYEKLGDPRRYLVRTFMGARTAAHQAALGCRFRCTFCGVAAMFRGATALPPAERFEAELLHLRNAFGADSLQFYDHNFFDREVDMVPLLEALARVQMPWWCYARADALLNLSEESWRLVRRSGLRMAYIGAETPNDSLLREIRKGTRADQTLEVAELCRRHGVIPELSFMVAPPQDPEGETERTFDFIRQVKRVNPDAEIIVYVYTPLPREAVPDAHRLELAELRDADGGPLVFPRTPEQWSEPRWVDYACHADAPWLSEPLRRRIRDFVTVLRCRFPTVQDTHAGEWSRRTLRALASWRYHFRRYDRPWELALSNKVVRLLDPRVTSL
jgi:anaerobic magnesium-protoporphyrin IX monomethyl ester cyclase